MAEVHPTLQNPNLRFALLGSAGEDLKRPFERGWQETANYTFDDPKLLAHRGNYGVCGGYGDLHILDCDDLSRWEELGVLPLIPATFTVESRPGHRQFYLRCKGHFESGGLFDPKRLEMNENGKPEHVHIGDLKSGSKGGICGGQAVGPGCKHPSGSTYVVVVEAPIAEVTPEHLHSILGKFKRSKRADTNYEKLEQAVTAARQRKYEDSDPLDRLQVRDIMPPEGHVTQSGGELRGDHPVHGSTNGGNYVINLQKNVWHCMRCESGGGPAQAIAVKHGLISCSDARPGVLRGDLFRKVLEIAERDYGLGNGHKPRAGEIAEKTLQCIDSEPLTEGGNATRLERLHGDDLRFNHSTKSWYLWEGGRWKIDTDGGAARLAVDVISSLYEMAAMADGRDERNAIAKFAKETDSRKGINNMLALAESRLKFAVTYEKLDTDPWLLGADGVTMDLRTGEAREPRREDLITRSVGTEYDPDAKCPLWENFLEQILPDPELRAYVKRAVGYCLTGSMVEQVFFFCHGSGANGKSVFLGVLRSLLGDYAKQADFSTFLVQHTEKVRNDLAALNGARLITATEAEEGGQLSMQVIKSWTGEDPITTRFLFGEFFTFRPVGKLWLAANNKPAISDRNLAAWRRVRLIPFTVTIPEERQDKKLEQKLLKELPGILNWALEGLKDYLENGLQPPAAVKIATNEYRLENDSLSQFISTCCIVDKLKVCTNRDLFTAYQIFCRDTGLRALSQHKFSTELKGYPGVSSVRSKYGANWLGIGLKNELVTDGDGSKSIRSANLVTEVTQFPESSRVEKNSKNFPDFKSHPSPDSDLNPSPVQNGQNTGDEKGGGEESKMTSETSEKTDQSEGQTGPTIGPHPRKDEPTPTKKPDQRAKVRVEIIAKDGYRTQIAAEGNPNKFVDRLFECGQIVELERWKAADLIKRGIAKAVEA